MIPLHTLNTRRLRWVLLLPLASVAIYACSETPTEAPVGYDDVGLEGKVTDETLVAFIQALEKGAPKEVASQAAVISAPATGEVLARNPPPSFRWGFGAEARRSGPALERWAGLDATWRPAVMGLVAPLRELLGPPRSALAHGDPYSGIATYLVFSTEANPRLLRVLTSAEELVPSQAAWDEMAKQGKAITLTLVSAIFEQNRVTQDGGPFAGKGITFTIAP